MESQFGFGLTLYSANKPVRRGQRRTKHAFSGREQKQLARGDFIRVLGYHRSCRRRASGNTCCHRGRRRHHRLVVCCQRCEVCPEWGGRVPDQCARALKTTLPATHRSQVSPATDVPSVRYGKDPQSLDLTSTEGETRAYLAGATVHNHVTLKPLEVRNCLKLFLCLRSWALSCARFVFWYSTGGHDVLLPNLRPRRGRMVVDHAAVHHGARRRRDAAQVCRVRRPRGSFGAPQRQFDHRVAWQSAGRHCAYLARRRRRVGCEAPTATNTQIGR